jgi:hypothetical protein
MEPCPLLMVTSFTNANSRTRFFTWESTYVMVASHSCSRLLALAWLVDEVDDFFSYRAFSVHKYFGFSHFQFRQCRFPFPVHAGIQADKRAEGCVQATLLNIAKYCSDCRPPDSRTSTPSWNVRNFLTITGDKSVSIAVAILAATVLLGWMDG